MTSTHPMVISGKLRCKRLISEYQKCKSKELINENYYRTYETFLGVFKIRQKRCFALFIAQFIMFFELSLFSIFITFLRVISDHIIINTLFNTKYVYGYVA